MARIIISPNFQAKISMFDGVTGTIPVEEISVGRFLKRIRDGKYRKRIGFLRKLKKGDPDAYSVEKRNLPAATPAGLFDQRKTEFFRCPSGFLVADIDGAKDLGELMRKLRQDPFVAFAFISPSGDGAKVGFWIGADGLGGKSFKAHFQTIQKHLRKRYQVEIDPARKDLAGLCFVSYDPELHINRSAKRISPFCATSGDEDSIDSPGNGAEFGKIALEAGCESVRNAQEGNRNDLLNKEAFYMGQLVGRGCLDRERAESDLLKAGVACGLPEPEVRRTISSGITAGMSDSSISPPGAAGDGRNPVQADVLRSTLIPASDTDQGNADRLVSKLQGRIKFTREAGWMLWAGGKWEPNETGVRHAAREAIYSALRAEILQAMKTGPHQTANLVKWWKNSESAVRIAGALALAEGDPVVFARKADFDRDPMLLNVQNGIIDLRTGRLSPHDPNAMLTRISPATFDPDAECPLFLGFLNRIFKGDADLISFVQRAIGYSLTGDISEQVWFLLYGSGQNGKSTLVGLVSKLLGGYAGKTGIDTFMVRANQQIGNTPEIAALDGTRCVYATEPEEGRRLAVGRIKDMTGGEPICATPKYRDPYNFDPVWKLWISGNHRPVISETTKAAWRRIRLIPFDVEIKDEEKDLRLPQKLERELPGILRWAVEGCLKWQKEGLGTCDVVKTATDEYRQTQDNLGEFLADCCIIPTEKPGAVHAPASDLFTAYSRWCEMAGEPYVSQRRFGEALSSRGFQRFKGKKGLFYWKGLKLKDDLVDLADRKCQNPLMEENKEPSRKKVKNVPKVKRK